MFSCTHGHSEGVHFCSDGQSFVTASDDKTVKGVVNSSCRIPVLPEPAYQLGPLCQVSVVLPEIVGETSGLGYKDAKCLHPDLEQVT